MKIALCFFQRSKSGGNLTRQTLLSKAYKEMGHQVEGIYLTQNTKYLTKKDGFDRMLGFINEKFINETIRYLSTFDMILWTSGVPHITKETKDNKLWMRLFKELNVPNGVIITDRYVDKFYPWIREIAKYTKIIPCHQKGIDSFKEISADKKVIRQPMSLTDIGLYDDLKEDLIVDNNHFKAWKHKEVFVRCIPLLPKEYKKYNFGTEIMYYILRNGTDKEFFNEKGEKIWDVALSCGMEYKGCVGQDVIAENLKKAKVQVNMSRFTLFNDNRYPNMDYSTLEAMKYGAIPLTNAKLDNVFKDGENYIMLRNMDDHNELKNVICDIIENWDNYRSMREANIRKLKENYDINVIAKQFIDHINKPITIERKGLFKYF